jgi:polyisoprenyl-teichoic acid--peptidoglycan teichoic acid transferase
MIPGAPLNRSQAPRAAEPRAAGAAALSFLFPGLGQAYNRRWALAWLFAVPALLIVILFVLAVALGGRGILTRLLDSRVLIALIVLDVALLGWRLVAIVQAHADRARLHVRAWPTWVTGLLVIATIGMHVLPAWYAGKTVDTLDRVSLEGRGSLEEREGIELPEPSIQPERGERVTVLLVGVDFEEGRDHRLTDTMVVATIDPETNRAAMISVPRDLYGVPLGDGRVYNAKLNSLMTRAGTDATTYPLGGPGTLKRAIGELLGTQIHYFAAIDIEGMRQLIDAVGGVDVVVERPIHDSGYRDRVTRERGFSIEAGPQHLNGARAMAYIRSRKTVGEDDFTRAERQQQVLTAIAEKLTAGNILVTLPALLDTVRDNVVTDVPSRRIPGIAVAGEETNLRRIERVVLAPPEYVTPEPFSAAGYILHPNFEAIRALGERIFGTTAAGMPDEP